MKYSDVVGVEPLFDSTFNLTEEKENYWKQFISNKKFEDNLMEIITAFDSGNLAMHKSIWVQGTYGTGKSHSTSVVKHLLSDDLSDIQDFIDKIRNKQLKNQILAFRSSKKIFPVVLKGTNEIVDSEEMRYVIQRAVKDQLKEYDLTVKSDFESIIPMIDDTRFRSFWEDELKGELGKYAASKEEIKDYLIKGDVDVLKEINAALKAAHLMKATNNIVQWLKEVAREIRHRGIADNLVIFWDEFTSLLDIAERRSILNTIQDIAELSSAPDDECEGEQVGVYVFLVTHKNLESMDSYKELKEDEKSMAKDRFLELKYDMHTITTYHILSNAIKVSDEEKQESFIDERINGNISIADSLDRITEQLDTAAETKETIKKLYPFHPYTAYLATFVSRAIGSAERSIFEFLNDEKRGFKKFIENDVDEVKFLTADYVWDFFVDAFSEDRTNNFDAIINKFNMYIDAVSNKGLEYSVAFKTILLLNLLNRVTATDSDYQEKSLVNPSEQNIMAALSGSFEDQSIQEALDYINASQIIMRNPEGIFEVSSSAMPIARVQSAKEKLYLNYEDVSKIFEEYPITYRNLRTQISKSISREQDVEAFWGGSPSVSLESKLIKKFKRPFALQVAVLFFRGETREFDEKYKKPEASIAEQKNVISALSGKNDFKNIVFVVVDTPLGNNGFEGFIDSRAREMVAGELQLAEEKENYKKKAELWINDWSNKIVSSGKCTIIFRNSRVDTTFVDAGKRILTNVLPIIFKNGLDRIDGLGSSSTAWPETYAKKMVENVCFSATREEFESKLQGAANAVKYLLKDKNDNYIFDEGLNYIGQYDPSNPMSQLIHIIDEKIEKLKANSVVDLGKEFSFLSEPDYGYYPNYVCMSAVALAFRKYIEKIYKADQGSLINAMVMRDIVIAMFYYWREDKQNNLLRVRFSTSDEKELIELLHDVFKVGGDGIVETKWELRKKFEEDTKAPLWVLKFVDDKGAGFNKVIDILFGIVNKPNDAINQDHITELLTGLKLNKMDFVMALSKIKNQNGLTLYIKECFDKVNYSTEDLSGVLDYLAQELQGDIVYWAEDDVQNKVYQWCALQAVTSSTGKTESSDGAQEGESSEMVTEEVPEDDDNDDVERPEFEPVNITPIGVTGRTHNTIQNATELIEATDLDAKRTKEILVALCKEYPVICDKVIGLIKEA